MFKMLRKQFNNNTVIALRQLHSEKSCLNIGSDFS